MSRKHSSLELRLNACETCQAYDDCMLGQVATELLIHNRSILGDATEDLGVSFRRSMDRDASTDVEVDSLFKALGVEQRKAKKDYDRSSVAIRKFIRGIIDKSRTDTMLRDGAARDLRDKLLESPIGRDLETPHLVTDEQVREAMDNVVTHQDSGTCQVMVQRLKLVD